ncbi:MAG: hypothetical protein WC329_01685 [Candidatus Omnitrophota bacterium]|jgi:hypothetical protein
MCFGKKASTVPVSTSTKHIENARLREILQAKFPGCNIYLSDGDYRLCSEADMKTFLDYDPTEKNKYEAEAFDCDDFSYRLMGQFCIPGWSDLAFGIIWTNVHALNVFVTEDERVIFIEPQNDNIEEVLETWQGNAVYLVVM